jgi:hypothetical protein
MRVQFVGGDLDHSIARDGHVHSACRHAVAAEGVHDSGVVDGAARHVSHDHLPTNGSIVDADPQKTLTRL